MDHVYRLYPWGTLPFHVGNLSQWKRTYITPMIFMRSTTKFTCNYSIRSIAFLGVKVGEEKMASFKIRRVCQSRDTVRQKKSIAILPFYTYLSSCHLSRACKFKKCVVYFLWKFSSWLVNQKINYWASDKRSFYSCDTVCLSDTWCGGHSFGI